MLLLGGFFLKKIKTEEKKIKPIETSTEITIRQELNIAKWPIFTTSQFKGKTRKYTRKIKIDNETYAEKTITIKSVENENILRIFDYKVFCVLLYLWEISGRKIFQSVEFTFNQIVSLMNLKQGKTTTEYIKKSLMRLKDVKILWENNFYKKGKNVEEEFISLSLLDMISNFERKDELYFGDSSFRINLELLNNLLENYSKPMFLNEVLSLQKDISILLYNYLDLMLYGKNIFIKPLKKVFEDLDLQSYEAPSQRKRAIEPCLKELLNKKISSGILKECKIIENKKIKDYELFIEKEDFPINQKIAIKHNQDFDICLDMLNKKFPNKEIDYNFLHVISRQYDIERLIKYISKIPHNINNPLGFLKEAIKNNWVFPKNQEEIKEETKQKEIIQKQKKKIQEKKEKNLLEIEQKKDDKIWEQYNNLSKEKKDKIKKQAILKIEKDLNKKFNQDLQIDKLYFNDFALKINIIEILKTL